MPPDLNTPSTIIEMLRATTALVPDKAAIMAPGRPDLARTKLIEQVEDVLGRLNGLGFKRGSRVALAIPNGPEAAVAFIAAAAGMTAVPLNPNFQAAEFEFQLRLAKAEAVMLLKDQISPVRAVAQRLGVRIIELVFSPEMPAGIFEIPGTSPAPPIFAETKDIAVLMPTSGTTGLPKLIPLSQEKMIVDILYGATEYAQLEVLNNIGPAINMLPLFHGYGLIGSLLVVIACNGSAVCTAGFDVQHFFEWLDEYHPAFLLVLPTMLEAILAEAPAHEAVIQRSSLQYVVCSSAPLAEQTIVKAARVLNVPIIQAYGMTEVGTIGLTIPSMTAFHRPGSVGVPLIDTAIMAEAGHLLPPGEIGEIVVRSAKLSIYAGDWDEDLFRDGWFCTGDKGYLDADNYLYITGRVKESINRGGEKISPFEVEAILRQHPAIQDVVVFGVPHASLSEDLATAIVTQDPTLTPKQVRKFAGERLSAQKIPALVLTVGEIPKTPIGKVQRAALPQLLGLVSADGRRVEGRGGFTSAPVRPRSEIEQRLVELWAQILEIPEVGIHDDFFDLGGSSLQAAALVTQIAREFHTTLSVDTMFEAATVAEMAEVIARPDDNNPWPTLVPIQPAGTKAPFFCIPGLSGVVLSFRELALHLGSDQPVYGLQPPGIDGKTTPLTCVEDLAAHFVRAMRSIQPAGPYLVGGYSFGGMVALEIAQRLRAQGEAVALLASFDGPLDIFEHPRLKRHRNKTQKLIQRANRYWKHLMLFNPLDRGNAAAQALVEREEAHSQISMLPGSENVSKANGMSAYAYKPQPYEGRIVLFSTEETRLAEQKAAYEHAWEKIAPGSLEICDIPGDHNTLLHEPHVQALAEKLKISIENGLREVTTPHA